MMSKISIRDSSKNGDQPPFYRTIEMLVTVRLYHGGSYVNAPHVEGSVVMLDNVGSDYMSLDGVRTICDFVGMFGVMGFYLKNESGFQIIKCDRELKKCLLTIMMNRDVREVSIYVDCQGMTEIEGLNLGSYHCFGVDTCEDGGEGLDDDNEGDGYQSSESNHLVDSEYDMESDTDRGIVVESGNADVDFRKEIANANLKYNLQNLDENSLNDGIAAASIEHTSRSNANVDHTKKGKAVAQLEYESGEDNVVDSGDELNSLHDSDSENERSIFPVYDKSDPWDPKLDLGMRFSSKRLLKDAVQAHAIKTMRNITIIKNDKRRLYAKCLGKGCPWRLNAIKVDGGGEAFQIHHFSKTHECSRTNRVKCLNSTFIAKKYMKWFKSDPNRSVVGTMNDAMEDLKQFVSMPQMYRAKYRCLKYLFGDSKYQYSMLWDFIDEVKRTNPGSTLVLGTDDDNRFECFYMCLKSVKDGFLAGCRPIIGVDGCHLKGPYKGILLTAVGIDANNCLYPFAWAVVEKEDEASWNWFLAVLQCDLDIERNEEWTFMSDKQKGLLQAFDRVFPGANHRFCVRHLHGNFKRAGFTGDPLKEALWKAARSSTVNEFISSMAEMKELSAEAVRWLADKPPQHWSKSHFTTQPRCDILLNNCCESFNSCIKHARDKPILTMLEWIMEYVMKRHQKNRDRALKSWKRRLCPKIYKIIDKIMVHGEPCHPIKSNDTHYQVKCWNEKQYKVDLSKKTCGCRKWDISGIPCIHACSAINAQGLEIENLVHDDYSVDEYMLAYNPVVMPINGRPEWIKSNIEPPLPPNKGRSVGRPQTARRLEPDEPVGKKRRKCRGKAVRVSSTKADTLTKKQKTCKCSYCGGIGHNKKGCPIKKQSGHSGRDRQPTVDVEEAPCPDERNERTLPSLPTDETQCTEIDVLSQFDLDILSQYDHDNCQQPVSHGVEDVAVGAPPQKKLPIRRQNNNSRGKGKVVQNISNLELSTNSTNGASGRASINAQFRPPSRNQSMQSVEAPTQPPYWSLFSTPTLVPAPSIKTQLQQGLQGKVHTNTKQVINIAGGTFVVHGDNSSQTTKGKKKKT